MSYTKQKQTARFNFELSRNQTAKQAGSNVLSISTNAQGGQYAVGTTNITMTVKEAKVLRGFLNDTLGSDI